MTNVLEIHSGHYSLDVTLSIIHQFVALKMLCFALWNILKLTARLLYLVEYYIYIDNNFVLLMKNTPVTPAYTYNTLIVSRMILLRNQLRDVSVPHICITSYTHVNEI